LKKKIATAICAVLLIASCANNMPAEKLDSFDDLQAIGKEILGDEPRVTIESLGYIDGFNDSIALSKREAKKLLAALSLSSWDQIDGANRSLWPPFGDLHIEPRPGEPPEYEKPSHFSLQIHYNEKIAVVVWSLPPYELKDGEMVFRGYNSRAQRYSMPDKVVKALSKLEVEFAKSHGR